MIEKILTAVSAGAVGAFIGWAAQSLTLGGRVTAMEAALMRIEARMDRITPSSTWKGAQQ